MRKATLFALMLTLLLTACGGEEKDPVADLQRQYAAVTAATMEADITCHYDEEDRSYTLLCAYTPESSTVTVLAPANLAGISATVSGGELKLTYEDISLDAGSCSAAAVSPVAALPRLMAAAASGYPAETGEEDVDGRKGLRVAFDLADDEGTLYATWFDQETLLPLRSEISTGGKVLYEVAWTRFEVTGQTPAEPGAPEGQGGSPDAQPETPDAQSAPQENGAEPPASTAVSEGQDGVSSANPGMTAMASPADEAAAYAAAEE